MKYVKFLVLNIIVFGVLFTLISLLFPSVIQTSKTINIGGGENKILSSLSCRKFLSVRRRYKN